MEKLKLPGLAIYFEASDRETAEAVRAACADTIVLIRKYWGIEPPPDCRVYIMNSLLGFVFASAPWSWKFILALTLPLWYSRQARLWSTVGGYEQRFGRRRVVGVKSARLIQLGSSSLGEKIFIEQEEVFAKVQSVACHELTHAFTTHLPLPTWLKEGLAMLTVDRYFKRQTVRGETLEWLSNPPQAFTAQGVQRLALGDENTIVYQYALGYWLTRYLEDVHPGLLKDLFTRCNSPSQLESEIALALQESPSKFWEVINSRLLAHFVPGAPGPLISDI